MEDIDNWDEQTGRTSPLLIVLVGTHVVALDRRTGTRVWDWESETTYWDRMAIAKDCVIAGGGDRLARVAHDTGKPLWDAISPVRRARVPRRDRRADRRPLTRHSSGRRTIAACTSGISKMNVTATSAKLTHVHSAGEPMRASDTSMTTMPRMAWLRDGVFHTSALVVMARREQPTASTLFQFHGASLRWNQPTRASAVSAPKKSSAMEAMRAARLPA